MGIIFGPPTPALPRQRGRELRVPIFLRPKLEEGAGGRDSDWVLTITTSHPILAFHLKLALLSSPSQPFRAPSPFQGEGWDGG